MLGILIYLIYIILGLYITAILLNKLSTISKCSIGLGFGIVLSMWMPTIGAVITGEFNITANIIAIVIALLIAVGTSIYKQKRNIRLVNAIREINFKNTLILIAIVIPFIILIFILLDGHVLNEVDGAFYGGQSTYGDLPMHLGMITSIFTQGKFPPDYSILPGSRLCYPFLVNLQSASMCIFGTALRTSVIIPSLVMSLSCFIGIFSLAKSFAKRNSTAVLTVCLFFITGGLGFIYFLDSKEAFMAIFTEFYQTPTNNTEYNLRWVNIICDMMIPQRTFLAGLSVVAPCILLLKEAIDRNIKWFMLFAGIIASSLPMIHTHSFLGLGILCAGLLVFDLVNRDKTLGDALVNWGIFLIPVVVFALPQLIVWVFTQTEGFLRVSFDWVNEDNNFLWFWIKNIGVVFLLIIPALIHAKKDMRSWFVSATIIYILAEIIVFQPNIYDNNKLMIIWYIFVCIITADYLVYLFRASANITGRIFFSIIILVLLFLSGTLTIMREVNSNGQYMHFKDSQVETAEVIDNSTDADALFLTGRQHVNEISALAGRNIYAGSTLYLYFHGLDYDERYYKMENIYEDAEYAREILTEEGIDYIYISSYEWNDFDIDVSLYEYYPLVYRNGEISILAVSDRAIEKGMLAEY